MTIALHSTRVGSVRRRCFAKWAALLALVLTVLVSPTAFGHPTLGQVAQALSDLPRLRAQAGARSLRASDHEDAAKLGFTQQRSTEGEHAAEHEGVGEVAAAKRRPVGAPLSPLHDPDGRRISRTVSSTTANVTTFPDEEYFAWTGGNVVARLEKTGAVRQGFLFEGIDKPLRLRDAASNLKYYYELDIAGNVRRLRRTDGSDAGGYRYSGFGVQYPADQQAPIAAVDQPLRWKGRWWSDFAKIYDVRARQWSPELGSFTSLDEFGFFDRRGTLWGWGSQNPIRDRDPSGREPAAGPDWNDYGPELTPGQKVAGGAIVGALAFVVAPAPVKAAIGLALGFGSSLDSDDSARQAAKGPKSDAGKAFMVVGMVAPLFSVGAIGEATIVADSCGAVADTNAVVAKGGVQANRAAGNAFRDEIADALKEAGRDVETEVYKPTPFGKRFIDIEVSQDGQVLGGVETKLGGSPYTPAQRAKDAWLWLSQGYRVNLVRGP